MKKDMFTKMFMNAINWDKVKENEEVIEKIFNKEEKNSVNSDLLLAIERTKNLKNN